MASAPPPPPLPQGARIVVTAAGAVGAAIVTAAAIEAVTRGPAVSAAAIGALVILITLGDVSLLRVRFGRSGSSITWLDAALIVSVWLAGWPLVIALGPIVILVRQVLARRAVYKAVFNAGALATGALLGRVAYWVVAGSFDVEPSSELTLRTGVAYVVASAVCFVWVSVMVSVAVGLAQELPVRTVWNRATHLRFIVLAGNTVAGVAAIAIGTWSRPTLLALPFFLLALSLTYMSYLRAQLDVETWRGLQAVFLDMSRVHADEVVDAVRRAGAGLFGADRTEIALPPTMPYVAGADRGVAAPHLVRAAASSEGAIVRDVRRSPPAEAAEIVALGLSEVMVAALRLPGGEVGAVVAGFHGPAKLSQRERHAFATFANQVALSWSTARLFEESSGQRGRLSAIVDNASDGIVLLDAAGAVCAWNPAMTRLAGSSEGDAVGRDFGALLDAHGDDGAVLDSCALFARLGDRDQTDVPARLVRADGDARDLVLSVSPVRDSAGAAEYAVVVVRDITAAREVAQAKEDFIATVSHELRTPLTPIKGYLSLLTRPGLDVDEDRRQLMYAQMLEQAAQLERLVEDLLSVSRMEHGHFRIDARVVDAREVAGRAVRDQRVAGSREIVLECPPDPVPTRCDPARLRQVLANLLSNAEKYSPTGAPTELHVRASEDVVTFVVRDHGPGVPTEARELVFEPFSRLGDRLTRASGGTGLGLHIARRLVESMDGRIGVDAAPGGGAAFWVTLPAAGDVDSDPAGPSIDVRVRTPSAPR